MLDIIKSMYENVRPRVKHNNTTDFSCFLGVRQGESLSPFLFSMYLNDIEEHLILNGFEGIDLDMFTFVIVVIC